MRKFLGAILLLFCQQSSLVFAQDNAGKDNLRYIDPKIGNIGQLLQPTRPTVQLPHQVVRMYPQRNDYIDDQITSFPLTIVSHRLGEVFSLKPYTHAPGVTAWDHKLTYDHDLEVTRPWYYTAYLVDDEVNVEFSPGKKTGIFRFRFPDNADSKTLLFGNYNPNEASFSLTNNNQIQAMETYHGDIPVYMYGIFSAPGKAVVLNNGQLVQTNITKGKNVKVAVTFNGTDAQTLEFRYAVSFISAEQAKANFIAEIKDKKFDEVKADAEKAWDKEIGVIKVEGGTEAQLRSFYTAYYRSNERMVDITEDGKYFSGFDHKVHTTSRPFYTDDWTWDTYLALHPLGAILNPAREEDMLASYVAMYDQGGWMPTFPVMFGDHACMNGFHSSVMFLDSYRKGLRNFDVNGAFNGMVKNATQATMLPWRNGPKFALEDFYYKNGYYPALKKGEAESFEEVDKFEKRQAVAVTLGASYDDWAVGEMAKELKKSTAGINYTARALNYKNLWNDAYKMFIPKDANGQWIAIDPKFDGGLGGRDYYDENNGWTYAWQVQHNINGLMGLMGGKASFEAKLDQLFREGLGRSKQEFWNKFPDATGLTGQYSMGNEPSFHIPYLYNYTAPWKTQKHIRLLLDLWYKDNVFGIPGDEDGGGMSAFVVFSSMGFYPVTPGIPKYTIGSPVFSKVTINLQNGKQFKLIAHNSSVINKYIQSAKINGEELKTPWFTHEQLVSGAVIELDMGPKPNKNWGI